MRSPEDNSGATGAADVKADVKPEDNQVIAFPRFRPEDATLRLTDGREAAPASPAAPPKRKRDLRIDVFRGLALATIFIDHIPGNPYEHATLRNFGFSDAAEGFFLMSGIAAGIAYAGRFMPGPLAQNGAWAAIAPVWKRAWTLYLVQMFLTVWAIGIFVWGANTFLLPELLTQINLRQVFQNTEAALLGIPLLTHQLGYVNILPAYSVLLLAAPGAIWLGLRRPGLLLAISMSVWMCAGLWRLNFPAYPNPGGWFFNPFSWQLLFTLGLLTGLALRNGTRFVPKSPALFLLCIGYLLLVLAWKFIPAVDHVMYGLVLKGRAAGIPFHIIDHDKAFLSLQRLFHVLALAYVLSCLDVVKRFAESDLAAPLRLMGRNGLLVFSAGTLLSLLFQVFMAAGLDGRPSLGWTLPPIGLALLVLAAWINEQAKKPRAARAAAAPAPTDPGSGPDGGPGNGGNGGSKGQGGFPGLPGRLPGLGSPGYGPGLPAGATASAMPGSVPGPASAQTASARSADLAPGVSDTISGGTATAAGMPRARPGIPL